MFKSNVINGLVARFKSQYVPVRDEKLGIYLPTGDIAKAVKPEEKGDEVTEYRVFINNELTTVPAALVTTKFPVYRINKPVDQVAVGDIIRTGDSKKYTYRRVTAKKADGTIVSDSFGGSAASKTVAINDLLLGQKTVSVAINLFKGIGGGDATNFLQNPMALALLGGDSSDDDVFGTIFMLQAMGGQTNAAAGSFNNILPFLLMKDGDSDLKTIALMSAFNGGQTGANNILPLLLLSKSEDGGSLDDIITMSLISGNSPFTSLFNTPAVAPTAAVATPANEGTH